MAHPSPPAITERDKDLPLTVHDGQGGKRSLVAGSDGTVRSGGAPAPERIATGGMIDLQANGFAGIDFNSPGITAKQVDTALASMLSCGTTCCLPTLITAPIPQMERLLESLDRAVAASRLGPLMVAGYHLEGPFLSPEEGYRGAHDPAAMSSASIETAKKLMQKASFRPVRMWTVAPEIDGVVELVGHLAGQRVLVALGHTGASASQIAAAVAAGARLSTHLGNALPQLLPKRSNVLIEQLACDQLAASFIADGHHLPAPFLKMGLRCKGIERTVLITDAASPAGPHAPPGNYRFSSFDLVRDESGLVHKPGSTSCAGSSASMADVAAHVSRNCGFSLADIVTTARTNPLKLLGESELQQEGAPVNFAEWRQDGDGTWRVVAGHIGRLQATLQ